MLALEHGITRSKRDRRPSPWKRYVERERGARRKEGRKECAMAGSLHGEATFRLARASLCLAVGSVGHQVPVIVHKLTSPGKFLLDSSFSPRCRHRIRAIYQRGRAFRSSLSLSLRFFHGEKNGEKKGGRLFHGFLFFSFFRENIDT